MAARLLSPRQPDVLRALGVSFRPQQHVLPVRRRTFSQTTSRDASSGDGVARGYRGSAGQRRHQKSVTLQTQRRRDAQDTPRDVGLLPEIVALPPLSAAIKERSMSTLRLLLKARWTNFYRSIASIWAWKTQLRPELGWKLRNLPYPRPYFGLRKVRKEAKKLHAMMYTAFAEGNQQMLEDVCHRGLVKRFLARIHQRRGGEKLAWKALKYHGRPRLVSVRVGQVPKELLKDSALLQAVVRIESTQRLGREMDLGAPQQRPNTETAPKEQRIVEYLVLQKNFWEKEEDVDWKVWGLIDETSLESIKEDAAAKAKAKAKAQLSASAGKNQSDQGARS